MIGVNDYQRLGIATGLVLLLLIIWWFFLRTPPIEAPVVREPFINAFRLVRRGDDDNSTEDDFPIEDALELSVNTGCYLEMTFTPGSNLPESLDEEEVQAAEGWSFLVEIYSARDVARKHSVKHPFRHSKRDQSRFAFRTRGPSIRRVGPIASQQYWQKEVGYSGEPKKQEDWGEEEIRLWSFITPGPLGPGEYLFEIRMRPAARWTSSVSVALGPEIVVHRGKLTISGEEPVLSKPAPAN
ncbi:hypothetical protein [Thalassoglobus polymorphus]|uniref:Uncharacterized protein n=1 Tax=Thalassoglobus polymorphus TaxID=2527994 RepID=A0A517QII2_9PLAN|nr:hypothetical protein [Thalassoglobus polymorphus]QDT31425.1 hypothetical protein Mal48_06580 [Thalassoglobus polymorphus]